MLHCSEYNVCVCVCVCVFTRADKINIFRISYIFFLFLKLDSGMHCKGRRTAFCCSSLSQNVLKTHLQPTSVISTVCRSNTDILKSLNVYWYQHRFVLQDFCPRLCESQREGKSCECFESSEWKKEPTCSYITRQQPNSTESVCHVVKCVCNLP